MPTSGVKLIPPPQKRGRSPLNLLGDEILLDIPRYTKRPEVDLKVYFGPHIFVNKVDPLSFDDPEVSMLKDYLIGNFETHAKVVRIYCKDIPVLAEALKQDILSDLMPRTGKGVSKNANSF